MADITHSALRHIPKQLRGQRKVDHILHCAEKLFAEIGFENATTNAIALRADVSIGSLYQFFSSKDAVLEAMADRYLEQTRIAMSKALDSPRDFKLDVLLTSLLETLIKLQEQRPYFLQCLGRSHLSPVLKRVVENLNEAVAVQVVRLLERSTVEVDPALLRLRARICVETMGALLPLALHAQGRMRGRVTQEIKDVLLRYLNPMLKIEGTV